jgi:hypothetical protein
LKNVASTNSKAFPTPGSSTPCIAKEEDASDLRWSTRGSDVGLRALGPQ